MTAQRATRLLLMFGLAIAAFAALTIFDHAARADDSLTDSTFSPTAAKLTTEATKVRKFPPSPVATSSKTEARKSLPSKTQNVTREATARRDTTPKAAERKAATSKAATSKASERKTATAKATISKASERKTATAKTATSKASERKTVTAKAAERATAAAKTATSKAAERKGVTAKASERTITTASKSKKAITKQASPIPQVAKRVTVSAQKATTHKTSQAKARTATTLRTAEAKAPRPLHRLIPAKPLGTATTKLPTSAATTSLPQHKVPTVPQATALLTSATTTLPTPAELLSPATANLPKPAELLDPVTANLPKSAELLDPAIAGLSRPREVLDPGKLTVATGAVGSGAVEFLSLPTPGIPSPPTLELPLRSAALAEPLPLTASLAPAPLRMPEISGYGDGLRWPQLGGESSISDERAFVGVRCDFDDQVPAGNSHALPHAAPASPGQPGDRAGGGPSVRDSSGGAAPSLGTLSSFWWPDVPAAVRALVAPVRVSGRTTKYCGPPS
ncbi:hypothetical protein ACQP2X_13625 [Actinoplanes sp. CA-131856]